MMTEMAKIGGVITTEDIGEDLHASLSFFQIIRDV